MEHSLLNLERLTSTARFAQSDHHRRERSNYIIGLLAHIGDGNTVEVLKRVVGDENLGQGAITAIKTIKARLGSDAPAT